jgi:hypothetical protein
MAARGVRLAAAAREFTDARVDATVDQGRANHTFR